MPDVIIVEDNREIGTLLCDFLRKENYTVSLAGTGELAKGNLSVPIKAEKSRFLGRFLWGMDMLRETLEGNKEKELALQKEKNRRFAWSKATEAPVSLWRSMMCSVHRGGI